jgi:hypothetical protein
MQTCEPLDARGKGRPLQTRFAICACAIFLTAAAALTTGACGDEREDSRASGAKAEGDVDGTKPSSDVSGANTTDPNADLNAPKPPSTGNEMPAARAQLTEKQAMAALEAAKAEMLKTTGTPNCELVIENLLFGLPVIAPEINDEVLPAYVALQQCAAATSRWQTLLSVTIELFPFGADVANPAQAVRALVELGEFERAAAAIGELSKAFPDHRKYIDAMKTMLVCKAEDWTRCDSIATENLAALDAKGNARDAGAENGLRLMRAISGIVQGRLDAAAKDLDKVAETAPDNPYVTALRKELATAQINGMYIDRIIQPQVPLGVYHLYGTKHAGYVAELRLYNHANEPVALRIETEIPGVTEKTTNSVTLLAGAEREIAGLVPPLKIDFDATSVRAPRQAQLHVKVTKTGDAGDKSLLDETFQIKLLPRDHLPTRRKIGGDAAKATYELMAAWVTPNSKAIDEFLAAAKQHHPNKMFVGEQADTASQVAAIWTELQKRGVTYVMDPSINTDFVQVQRTRLPTEVLASTNAQCLEGTLLFATLLEAVGLRPIIVTVPGHAFVGWHATNADGLGGPIPLFVETTMIGNATFEEAVKVAMARVKQESDSGAFDRGVSRLLEVTELRAQGITAQPME